ncbi:UNVERIFIED_CONTAM: hypothetical protein O8I53_08075 [Campylobacter lari]
MQSISNPNILYEYSTKIDASKISAEEYNTKIFDNYFEKGALGKMIPDFQFLVNTY